MDVGARLKSKRKSIDLKQTKSQLQTLGNTGACIATVILVCKEIALNCVDKTEGSQRNDHSTS